MKIVIKEKEIKLNEQRIRVIVDALDKYAYINWQEYQNNPYSMDGDKPTNLGRALLNDKNKAEILRDLIDDAAGYNEGR